MLKKDFDKITQKSVTNKEFQQFLFKKQEEESKTFDNSNFNYLYPNLNDPNFNIKIAEKKEFRDTQYDGEIGDVKIISDKMCNAEFELAPYQQFVRNFLSFNTPYNSLLLYHGLGTGKTCSAISICEEMRAYLNQMGISQRIIIVAAPNVQENFKLQLFDERKLKLINGLWNIKACTGNTYLKEINPMNMKGLKRDNIIKQIKRLINNSYLFMGYVEFSNYISKKTIISDEIEESKKNSIIKRKLNKIFSNRLIVIDEIHNIRTTSDSASKKKVANQLYNLVSNVNSMRLLLLSATPMYNNYKEIIWLLNIMNLNDKRSILNANEVFDKNGDFKVNDEGEEIGKRLFIQKANGYVSFVRGNNPYTFPYRIFPKQFSPENSLYSLSLYPKITITGAEIPQPIEHIDLFLIQIGEYQGLGYNFIVDKIQKKLKKKTEEVATLNKLGYSLLQEPLEALNIVYPVRSLEDLESSDTSELVGKQGLDRIMSYKETKMSKNKYKYKPDILENFGPIFSLNEIQKYSSKIFNICNSIDNSDGIVLIYSQYIDGGLIPTALALEELGYKRYGDTSNLLEKPTEKKTNKGNYIMITGNKQISPDNIAEVKAATNENNVNGEKIKIILISLAGSEGIDFKNIRQVHILEPWYNMSRIEQIIGRAVRNCSHSKLPFEKRNVSLYLYGTLFNKDRETADMYVYRLAESKALQIGKISRVLKETAVDCLLNSNQNNFTEENMNQTVEILLSNKNKISYKVGDKPYTEICDYMESCTYKCNPYKNIQEKDINYDSYNENFIVLNSDKIIEKIKNLFREHYFYKKTNLINALNTSRVYPLSQINNALNQLITDKTEFLVDRYGRNGYLVNIGDYYLFQPLEINDNHISVFDRNRPLDFKHKSLQFLENIGNNPEKSIVKRKKILQKNQTVNIELILKNLEENFIIATIGDSSTQRTWYKSCHTIFSFLKDNISLSNKNLLLIGHLVDSTPFIEKKELINFLFFNKKKLSSFQEKLKNYFELFLLKQSSKEAIFIDENGESKLFIKSNNDWNEANTEDINDFSKEINNLSKSIIENLGNIVGYMSFFKEKDIVFKIIETRGLLKGKRFDQAGKETCIKIINNTLKIVDSKIPNFKIKTLSKKDAKNLSLLDLTCLEEILLRYFNLKKLDNKNWFLEISIASLINIENINKIEK